MRITVFTPTYNRAHIIHKLYQSLQRQTFKDFEWLVVDDGSSDNTREMFETNWCIEKNDFPIHYVYAENKGKMKEMNFAMDLAQGELFFTVDSDDWLTDDSLEKIDAWEKAMPHDGSFCGLAGRVGISLTESPADLLPEPYYDTTLFSRYRGYDQYHIFADRAWVFYTDIYRKYKFPEFQNEKFIAEAVSWNRMAHDGLRIRCFNDIVYMLIHQEGGLTNTISKTLANSPRGYGLWLSEMMDFMHYGYKEKIRQYNIFYCDLADKYSISEIAEYIQCPLWIMVILETAHKLKNKVKRI